MPTMGGFPQQVDVHLGTRWKSLHGLSSGSALKLDRQLDAATTQIYTENGSATPNTINNRVRLVMRAQGPTTAYIAAGVYGVHGSTATWTGGYLNVTGTSDYTFLDIFAGTGSFYFPSGSGLFFTGTGSYNGGGLSMLAAGTVGFGVIDKRSKTSVNHSSRSGGPFLNAPPQLNNARRRSAPLLADPEPPGEETFVIIQRRFCRQAQNVPGPIAEW